MTHLYIDLYDQNEKRLPCCTLDDHEVTSRQLFHDLHQINWADRATRVVIRPGDEYHIGDHICLMDKAHWTDTDTVTIDPDIAQDVDLNQLIIDNHSFANRTSAVLIVTNPHPYDGYRLRVCLYNQPEQLLPSLVFYDWEYPMGLRSADLHRFHFANKTAYIRVEAGPNYQAGDQVVLWEKLRTGARTQPLTPGDYDLSQYPVIEPENTDVPLIRTRRSWAETVAGIEFDLRSRVCTN